MPDGFCTYNCKHALKTVLACLLMSLVLSSTVYGNDLSHEDPALKEELFTVVVTASRIPQIITETPASVVVITREQLEETGAKI